MIALPPPLTVSPSALAKGGKAGEGGPMPTADEIFGQQLAPPPRLSSRPLLDLVVSVLPLSEDDLAADLLEQLALALIDRDDEVRGVRAVLAAALDLAHAQHVEILRLKTRLADLRDAGRRDRVAA